VVAGWQSNKGGRWSREIRLQWRRTHREAVKNRGGGPKRTPTKEAIFRVPGILKAQKKKRTETTSSGCGRNGHIFVEKNGMQ